MTAQSPEEALRTYAGDSFNNAAWLETPNRAFKGLSPLAFAKENGPDSVIKYIKFLQTVDI